MYTLQIAFQSLFRLNPNKNRLVDCFLLQPGHNSITQHATAAFTTKMRCS